MSEMRIGRFLPKLLQGYEALNRRERDGICDFFAAVAEKRGFPLHTAVLWNALYFSFDVEAGEYLGRGVKLEPADDGTPIPVGAFVDVPPPQTPIWGEVIYKEGRDGNADADTGLVDADLSGRRNAIAATDHAADVREALILDFDAFGADLHGYGEVHFARFVKKGWLDQHHHREVSACYGADEAADDLSVYVRYLLAQHGSDLFAEFVLAGQTLSEDDTRAFLLRSLQTVDQLAQECEALLTVGDYHLSRSVYERLMSAPDSARISGRDLHGMANRFGALAARSTRGWTAVGPMVLAHLARQGYTSEERLMVRGPAYATLVVALNIAIAECAGDEGLLDGRRHLRLDDDWNWGGVWLVEGYRDRPPDHARIHPLVPLGLGYATAHADSVETPPVQSGPLLEIGDRQWTVKLRRLDLEYGDLPILPTALDELPADGSVGFELGINGVRFVATGPHPLDRERRLVREIDYTPEFFPGAIVRCSLARGGRLLLARAHPLSVPDTIEGMTLTLEYDREVFRREMGLVPVDRSILRRSRTLVDQIATVFRQHGRPSEDGSRSLTAQEILHRLLGPEIEPATARSVLIALAGMDLDFLEGVYVWRPRVTRRTSARERVRIAASSETGAGRRLTGRLTPHLVEMHLRHYSSGTRHASAGKVAGYAAARVEHRAFRLPEQLPDGRTWVRPYQLGARQPVLDD